MRQSPSGDMRTDAAGAAGVGQTLPRCFYRREPTAVARDLLGKRIVRMFNGERLVGRIVETEAYRGAADAASHAHRGLTERNAPMFGPPGHAYVYFIYGMHWMFNITAHPTDAPGAVLIRALEPELGIETMCRLRAQTTPRVLTNGPAKLAQALAIDGDLNALDLCCSRRLVIVTGALHAGEQVVVGPRVRVPGDRAAQERHWRFWIDKNPWVSN
jgi:DNA-3-methyladenine glycosylase